MIYIDTVLIKVASRCNINCTYCYVYNLGDDGWKDMPHFISKENISHLTNSLKDLSQKQSSIFATVLHGGEPLMLGPRRLENLLKSLRTALHKKYPISIQTNGTLITTEILDICSKYHTTLSISIDGPEYINDKYRVDKKEKGTYKNIIKGIDLLREHPDSNFLYAGLLAVVDPSSNPEEVYSELNNLGASSINFLPQDGNHSNLPLGKSSFLSTEYGDWLCKILDLYLIDKNPARIRILDDMIRLSLGGDTTKEGFGEELFNIIIIETDGSIAKNDTLKSNFPGADKFKNNWHIKNNDLLDIIQTNEFQEYNKIQNPTSTKCLECNYLNICGGGMPLHRWSESNGYNNTSIYCEDQKLIISKILSILKNKKIIK